MQEQNFMDPETTKNHLITVWQLEINWFHITQNNKYEIFFHSIYCKFFNYSYNTFFFASTEPDTSNVTALQDNTDNVDPPIAGNFTP